MLLFAAFMVAAGSQSLAGLSWTYNAATDVPVTSNGYNPTGTATLALNFAPPVGTNLTVVKNTALGFINGTFSNLAQGQRVALAYKGVVYTFVVNYFGGSGKDLVLQWADTAPMAWGRNSVGQVGNGNMTDSLLPTAVNTQGVLAGKSVDALAAGVAGSLALCGDGTVIAWGDNYWGELGNNSPVLYSLAPVAVDASGVLAGKRVVAISAGSNHCLALCNDGTVAAWGYNADGELGNNSTTKSPVPVAVTTSGVLAGKTVIAISAGQFHSLALCNDGTMVAWGVNANGQLGNSSNNNSSVPVAVNTGGVLAGKTVVAIAAGGSHNLALCSDGTVVAWGSNSIGQLGNGSKTDSSVPVAVNTSGVLAGRTVVAIAAGSDYGVARCSDGTIAAWGPDSDGELGNNSTTTSLVPVAVDTSGVLAGKTVVTNSGGYVHSLAMCSDGTAVAWGDNYWGELGINSTTDSFVPIAVNTTALPPGGRFVAAFSSPSAYHSLAVVAVPETPGVVTLAAAAISATGAVLNGTVDAWNNSTAVSFDYGSTAGYGTNVAGTSTPVTGNGATAVSATLTGLTPGTTYHFRVNGVSAAGTGNGNDVTFTTPLSDNASLLGLAVSAGTLSPAFARAGTNYSVTVPNSTSTITMTPTVADPNAAVTVNGTAVTSGSASNPIVLNVGHNVIPVVVTAQDGTTRENYTITLLRMSVSLSTWSQTYFGSAAANTDPMQ